MKPGNEKCSERLGECLAGTQCYGFGHFFWRKLSAQMPASHFGHNEKCPKCLQAHSFPPVSAWLTENTQRLRCTATVLS